MTEDVLNQEDGSCLGSIDVIRMLTRENVKSTAAKQTCSDVGIKRM